MRGVVRLLIACGLVAVVGVIAASGSGAATTSGTGAGQFLAPHLSGSPFSPVAAPVTSQQSTSFAGYAAFSTASTTVSSTFKVPHPTCDGTSASGISTAVIVDDGPTTSETDDGIGTVSSCASGSTIAHANAAANLAGAAVTTIPTTDKVKFNDVMKATVKVNATTSSTSTTLTLVDTTALPNWTFTIHGTDSAPDAELIGAFGATSGGVAVPLAHINAAKYSASTVNGVKLASATSLSKISWVASSGCSTLLMTTALDATGEIFTVKPPVLNITSISPTSGPAGTVVTINGTGFNSGSTVTFKGGAATSVDRSGAPTVLKATAPATVKTGPIVVKNTTAPIGAITSACTFTAT